jgi:hypothetical protein
MVSIWTLLSNPGEALNLERWTRELELELERRGTRHPRLPWRRGRSSRSLDSDSEERAGGINNALYMLSSVLPDVTDEWVCDAAAQLRELPVLDTVNTNSMVASAE